MKISEYVIPFAYQQVQDPTKNIKIIPVPNDFELAAIVIQAYNKFNKNIIGIMKMYYPLYLINAYNNRYLIFDAHQFISSVLEEPTLNKKIETITELLQYTESDASLFQILNELNELKCSLETKRFLGLFPPLWVREIQSLVKFKEKKDIEPYAIIIENEKLAEEDFIKIIKSNRDLIKKVRKYQEFFKKLKHELSEIFNKYIKKIEMEIDIWHSRYNGELYQVQREVEQRIKELKNKMDDEINKIVQWRDYNLWYYQTYFDKKKSAQIRTIKQQATLSINSIRDRYSKLIANERRRIHEIEQKKTEAIQPLIEKKAQLSRLYFIVFQKLERIISDVNISLQSIQSHLISHDFDGNEIAKLLIPFYIIITKDVEKTKVYPLMRLKKDKGLSLFHSFDFPFNPLDRFWEQFNDNLMYRIRTELILFSQITRKMEFHNILFLDSAKKEFESGFNALLINGWVKKKELLNQIEKLFKIKKIKGARKKLSKEVYPTGDLKEGKIVIKVIDADKHPISDAQILVDNKIYSVEADGTIILKMPAGTYNILVSAEGYKDREETIRIFPEAFTTQIIRLEQIALSEILPTIIPEILQIAKKYGFKSLATEEKVKDIANKLHIEESRIWRELYSYLVQEWIKRGKEKQAIETALLFIAKQSEQKGGIMPLADVILEVQSMGIMADFSEIEKVLSKLIKEKLIYGIQEVEGTKMVFFKSVGLSGDYKVILELAAKYNGELTREQILVETGWSNEHIEIVLNYLEESGIAISGTVRGKMVWWFPAFYKRR